MPKYIDSSQLQTKDPSRASESGSPADSTSSASTSSLSNSGHGNLVTRSQLYKRPPRFKVQPSRELLTYAEEAQEFEDATQNSRDSFPFAKVSRTVQRQGKKGILGRGALTFNEQHDTMAPTQEDNRTGMNRMIGAHPVRAHETSSSTTSSVNETGSSGLHDTDPSIPKHHQETSRTNMRGKGSKAKKDGSEGTPSMGSSFSDIDGTYSSFPSFVLGSA